MVSSSRVFKTVTVFFSACLAVILLFSQTSAATLKSFTLTYDVDLQSAREQFTLINEWRTSGTATYKDQNGNEVSCGVLKAYTYDYTLEQIALQRAYEVAVKFGHTRPNGNKYSTCTVNGVIPIGECCAINFLDATAQTVFTQFQENITPCSFKPQGVFVIYVAKKIHRPFWYNVWNSKYQSISHIKGQSENRERL